MNKEALIRYRVIDKMLVNRKFVTKQELILACEDALDKAPISARTIDDDIFNMRYSLGLGFDAPIAYNKSRRAYCYEDTNYSIEKFPLKDEEVHSMFFAAKLLEQYKGVEIFQMFSGAVDRIINTLKIRKLGGEKYSADYIEFAHIPTTTGDEFLQPIFESILNKTVIMIKYHAFGKVKSYKHIFHPYFLKEFSSRWYVFGYNEYWKAHRTYALDRIEHLEILEDKEYIQCEFNPKEYFQNIIGITKFYDTVPPEIKLRFSRKQAFYLNSQPIHPSQKIIDENEDTITFSLTINSSPELEMIILSRGPEVEVLEPVELRNGISKRVKEMEALYRVDI